MRDVASAAAKDRMRDSYAYKPEMFDMGLALEGAAFTVRRSGNDLWDEIVIELAPKASGAIQLPIGNCLQCNGARFTCEAHPDRPWPHDDCAGPGVPCSSCQPEERPDLPAQWGPIASTRTH